MANYQPFDFEQFRKIWRHDVKPQEITEINHYLENNPLLHATMMTQGSAFAVLNLETMHYNCLLGDVEGISGHPIENVMNEGVAAFLKTVTLEEYSGLNQMLEKMNEYFIILNNSQSQNFRAIFEMKLKRADGTYSRMLQENFCMKRLPNGAMQSLFMVVCDVTHVKKEGKQHLLLTDGIEKRLFQVDNTTDIMTEIESLSKRELEIAKFIGQKFTSEQIAEKLSISLHTVNTHRRNMLDKLDMIDTMEMINFLRIYRMI
jgi:DNA-binding CsgD family transcriptional regulator